MKNHKSIERNRQRHQLACSALSLAVAATLGIYGSTALAQATTGAIFGQAQVGSTVLIQSTSGLNRQVAVDATGHYAVSSLPLGSYTVTLQQNGQAVDSRSNVTLRVGSGTEVSFGTQIAQNLAAVTVQANALPTIDVSGVDSRTVITSEQMARLPLLRSAEAIALLAPGAVEGSQLLMGMSPTTASVFQKTGAAMVSFGGSSVSENAYYINGFNTTDPLGGLGGVTLPYGSIEQQEILSGGYGAAYGRSDGGVISQVGKRGTNEWHFGGQVQWSPTALEGDPKDYYLVNTDGSQGNIRQRRHDNKSWVTTVDAYAGGPLIKDTLFLFVSMEAARQQGQDTGTVAAPFVTHYRIDSPKWYAKLDWNINDSNILEVTGASNKTSFQGGQNDYDYATRTEGGFNSYPTWAKSGAEIYSAKFTSYLTDNLTLSALYGKMSGTLYSQTPGYDPSLPALLSPERQNPALTSGGIITNSVSVSQFVNPAHTTENTNLRLDLSYRLGSHTVTVGIDNQNVLDNHDGQVTGGPDGGYSWLYENGTPMSYIKGGPVANGPSWQSQGWVDAPGNYAGGATGYYVSKQIFNNEASVRVKQHAQYIEDSWQINDRWLVKLGLRNDQFTNYNGVGVPYMRLTKPQWAPRVGFSWDVNGDSSFKVYGNAGRYFLALPAAVALRSAGASIFTNEYFTYTGIDANGLPTGLTPIANSQNGPYSTNREYGVPRDPKAATATNIKSEYQDEYILGFDKKLNDNWVYGAKATYRNLRRAVDDWGDTSRIIDKMNAMGIDPATYSADDIAGSYLINPGENPIIKVAKLGGGYYDVPLNWRTDMGFTTSLKRKYYGLDVYLEHPFDGRWAGRIDYLFSRSYGNSEGQVRSDIGQTDVSATVDWDYAQVMEYANGALANDRRHQIKAYGSYQVAPEWMLSGNLAILSGSPRSCLGFYGPNETNPGLGYNAGYYHWCGGTPSAPGEHRQPWTYLLSLSAEYRPDWADKKLGFNVMVYNVLDQQETLQTRAFYGSTGARNSRYLQPMASQTPRFVRFGISYDF